MCHLAKVNLLARLRELELTWQAKNNVLSFFISKSPLVLVLAYVTAAFSGGCFGLIRRSAIA
jgi:hypothetical protein